MWAVKAFQFFIIPEIEEIEELHKRKAFSL